MREKQVGQIQRRLKKLIRGFRLNDQLFFTVYITVCNCEVQFLIFLCNDSFRILGIQTDLSVYQLATVASVATISIALRWRSSKLIHRAEE